MYTTFNTERGPIDPRASAGRRTFAPLITDVRTSFIDVVVHATVVIAVAAVTSIRNRGRAVALLSECGITEGGTAKWNLDPRVAAFASEQLSPSKLTTTPLTSTAVGTYNLVDRFRLCFAHPYSVDPRETFYTERNPLVDFSAFFTLDSIAAGLARLVDAGPATVTLTALTLEVEQTYDRFDKKLPYFLPQTEAIIANVSGASSRMEIPLKYSDRLRAITVSQDTDVGEVTDIINRLTLRGDSNYFIENVSMDALARAAEYEQGGDVYASSGGRHTYINFQRQGKLTNILSPSNQDTNLRLVLDVQPSASGTVSRVIVTLWKLVRDDFVGPDGLRRVVDPNVPFSIY